MKRKVDMETIKGVYKGGRIHLSRRPRTKSTADVTVIFEKPARRKAEKGLTHRQFHKLVGLFSIGGDALKDTEDLYS